MAYVRSRDRGSMSVELAALVWPATVVMVVLLVGVWQMSAARLDVHTAAAAAARSASLVDAPAVAAATADQAARAALADAGFACEQVDVDVNTSGFRRGGVVEVTVRCRVGLRELIGLDLPGGVTVAASARAPVETHRELEVSQP